MPKKRNYTPEEVSKMFSNAKASLGLGDGLEREQTNVASALQGPPSADEVDSAEFFPQKMKQSMETPPPDKFSAFNQTLAPEKNQSLVSDDPGQTLKSAVPMDVLPEQTPAPAPVPDQGPVPVQQPVDRTPAAAAAPKPAPLNVPEFKGEQAPEFEEIPDFNPEQSPHLQEYETKLAGAKDKTDEALDEKIKVADKTLREAEALENDMNEVRQVMFDEQERLKIESESLMPKISQRIAELESERDKLLNKLSTPVQRKNLLFQGGGYQAIGKLVFSGFFDALGQIANVKGGTNHKTFLDLVDEEIEKQYEEDLRTREQQSDVYNKVGALIQDSKSSLLQYKNDYYSAIKEMLSVKEQTAKGSRELASLEMVKTDLDVMSANNEEEMATKLYNAGVNDVTQQFSKYQARATQTQVRNQNKLAEYNLKQQNLKDEYNSKIKKIELEKESKKEAKKEKLEADKFQLEKDFKGQKIKESKANIGKQDVDTRLKEAKIVNTQADTLNKLDGKAEKVKKSKGSDFYYQTSDGKTVPVKLTERAGKNSDVFKRVSGGQETARVYKETRDVIKDIQDAAFSGNVVQYFKDKKTKLEPRQTQLKALVRIMLTGGGNISDKEQVYLNEYVSGDIDMLTLFSKLGGGEYSTGVDKFNNYYTGYLKSLKSDIKSYMVPGKEKEKVLSDLNGLVMKEKK